MWQVVQSTPTTKVARAAGAPFVGGTAVWQVQPHAAKAFLAAAPKGATWKVYSGGHSATPAADQFWQAWMLKNL